ncbi:MAG: hypothetical protein Hyperionvirus53_2 [Hyperionvirus sp.]|uniref:Uncharacterized protein n=1 Tax=Hyperionvirus sp. TaxID=2487770 RepID=A0A3G5ACM6_9VIRU|nr:MAG: hypothetical protein Hyperionvirus53_2 [Hyperionvirus sp.]
MPITVRLDNSIYDGTIFDGTLIHPQGNQNKLRTFVITDLFMFRGKNMTNDKIQYKIMNLVAYLKANMKEDKMNTLDLMVNKLFEPEQIDSLVKEHIPSMKNFNIKGVAFYPEISGTKLIFMLDNSQRDGKPMLRQKSPFQKEEQMTKYVPAQPVDKKSVRYVAKYDDEPVFATFEFKKTKDTDVYKIYLVETVVRDKKSILVSKKMGIAFVPTTDCSSMCREAFSQNPNSRILMKCRFINDKSKWQPISHDKTAKFPSNFSTIEEKLQMLEENCSDEDCD